jgi:hypothetical protein
MRMWGNPDASNTISSSCASFSCVLGGATEYREKVHPFRTACLAAPDGGMCSRTMSVHLGEPGAGERGVVGVTGFPEGVESTGNSVRYVGSPTEGLVDGCWERRGLGFVNLGFLSDRLGLFLIMTG